jgi:hypothetical protein
MAAEQIPTPLSSLCRPDGSRVSWEGDQLFVRFCKEFYLLPAQASAPSRQQWGETTLTWTADAYL